MRRTFESPTTSLLTAVLLVVLAACGDDAGSGSGGDGAAEDDGTGRAGWRLVEIVSETAVGGRVSKEPSPIGTPTERRAFTARFTRPAMEQKLRTLSERHTVANGWTLAAAVVWIGCEVPTGVAYEDGEVIASPVPKETVQCFAPVTSVAVLEVTAPLSGDR